MFPSPLGVLSFFMEKMKRKELKGKMFPSPLGVLSFFIGIDYPCYIEKSNGFPSPLGVLSFFIGKCLQQWEKCP